MPKLHPADAEAARFLTLSRELSHRKANRPSDLLLLLFALLFFLGFGISIVLLPQKTFSEAENRTLDTFPAFSAESLFSGDFSEGVRTFYEDQFPARDAFVSLRAGVELALLRKENNGVLIGKGGYLIDRLEYNEKNYQSIEANLSAVSSFTEKAKEAQIEVTFAVAPRTIDVATRYLPDCYDTARAAELWRSIQAFQNGADTAGAVTEMVLFTDLLRERCDAGEEVMYRTDHHWTTLGAYYAYTKLGPVLGYTPYSREDFEEITVSESFYGTTYSSAGIRFVAPDSVVLFRYDGDTAFAVESADGTVRTGFYREEFLDQKDKYGVFFGGNEAHIRIYAVSDGKKVERETLLLVKDSFALSLAPFLARHYNLELVDLRYYPDSLYRNLTEETGTFYGIDKVLILVGADTLSGGAVLRKLMLGASR